MKKTLTEQNVLRKLGIDDFRHMTKDKVMVMASMLDKMDPEVAKKALEQFPNFSDTMKSICIDYKSVIERLAESNDNSVKSYYETCDAIISSCQIELARENLSFEEKRQILTYMLEVVKMKGIKDTENKNHLLRLSIAGLSAVGLTAIALVSALGGNTKIDLKHS